MKIALLLFTVVSANANGFTQSVTLAEKNAPPEKVFKKITSQTGYTFVYTATILKKIKNISIVVQNAPLEQALDICFREQPVDYTILNKMVVIKEKVNAPRPLPSLPTEIKGTVKNESGGPVPGATITVKGTTITAQASNTGDFTITVPDGNDILVVTSVGYTDAEVKIGSQKFIPIILQVKVATSEEVIVVGYGVQKKISSVGAISSIKPAELKQPVANLSTVIAGRVAGVVGVQRSGEPGYDNADIYIRGISTFTSSRPLVLVDGVERDFNNIDPEDIASFTILKDASATAVYGVRGANGVILITLKKGRVGKSVINLQYDEGITQFTKIPEFADGVIYLQMANEAYHNSNPADPLPRYTQDRIDKTASGEDPDLYPNAKWFDLLFNKLGQNRRVRVNANGGSENAQYYLSVGYYDEKGMYKTDALANYDAQVKFRRYNFTMNLGLNVTKTTKVDFGASGWLSNGNFPGNSATDIWEAAYKLPPVLIPAVYSNGLHSHIRTNDVYNPYNSLTQSGYVSQFRSQLWSNIRVTQDLRSLLTGLTATGMFSFDNYNEHSIRRTKTVDGYIATGRDTDGNLLLDRTSTGSNFLGYDRTNGGSRQFYTELALNYARDFGLHSITGLLLYNQSDREDAFAGNFINSIPYRYMGLAGRTTYAYDDKYLAEFNFGYNGSETFAPNKRFGFFPSFGIGWVVSNENFYKPVQNAIQFFKLRYTYGTAGNSNIGGRRFAYISTVGDGSGDYTFGGNGTNQDVDGLDIGDYAVNVTWEKSVKQNLGFELRTWNGALTLMADCFYENRSGIFRQRGDVPGSVGILALPWANLGEIHNRGIDASIELDKTIGSALQLGFKGNFTWNRAKVINDANAPWPYPWQQRIGRKFGQRFGYTALGLFTSEEEIANSAYQTGTNKPGDIKYKDLNGDGKIDSYDEGPIGYGSFPEIVYGFGPTISWKRITIAGWFKGISNVDISLSGDGFQPFSQGGERGNLLASITDRWTPDNPNPRPFYPRLTYGNENMNYRNSTWWMKNGAFLRLQTLLVNYDFGNSAKWMKRAGMLNMSIYFMGENLFTMSGFKLWDVELGDGRGARYPLIKTFSAGLRCTFR